MGYTEIHTILKRTHGPAHDHLCCACGKQAAQWAYQGNAPDEAIDSERHLKFSNDMSFYKPMCRRCHNYADKEARTIGRIHVYLDAVDSEIVRTFVSERGVSISNGVRRLLQVGKYVLDAQDRGDSIMVKHPNGDREVIHFPF
jgi:hypothetical protein